MVKLLTVAVLPACKATLNIFAENGFVMLKCVTLIAVTKRVFHIVYVLLVNTSEKARNIQERWLVALLYTLSMRPIVLPAFTLRNHIVKLQKLAKMITMSFRLCLFLAHSADRGRLKKLRFSSKQHCTEKWFSTAAEIVFPQINLFSFTLTTP